MGARWNSSEIAQSSRLLNERPTGGTDVPQQEERGTSKEKQAKPKPVGKDTPPEVFKPEPSIIRAKEGFYGFIWEVATSELFKQQIPESFRLVVRGPLDELPQVIKLLSELKNTKKEGM